jgi:L-alanine-DL-glutamate epimerase-like enolase superfamily enzyme
VAGEYCVGLWPVRHLLEVREVDVVMIYLPRVGSINTWLKVAAMAEAFNVLAVSHRLPEIHVQLVDGVPKGLSVAYRPSTERIFDETAQLANRCLVGPDRPGRGLQLDARAVKKYQIG